MTALPELMDSKAVATMLGLSRHHTVNAVMKRPDFPPPKVNLSRKTRYWLRDEVTAWVRKATKKANGT